MGNNAMVYADYNFYTMSYCGDMSAQEYTKYAPRASMYLDKITFGRISQMENVPDTVKYACCAVAEELLRQHDSGGIISSETNDGISVTYATESIRPENRRQYDAAAFYLAGTGLLYRGCSPC